MTGRQIECVVAALLAVNNYPLYRVRGNVSVMRTRGLLDPERVSAMEMPAVIEALSAA